MITGRKGFTLVELIIVTVLGSFVVAATLQVLITNQRTYTAQNARIQAQQATRAGMSVLQGELREISAQGGDILAMGSDSISIRVMNKFGVACAISTANPPVITALKVGDFFEQYDSVFIFADNNVALSGDDDWISARVTSVDTTATCGTDDATALSFSGQSALFTADSVRTGAMLRSYRRATYGLTSYNGSTFLGRADSAGVWSPLVGPLDSINGLEFAFLDQNGATTTTANLVRQITITLRVSTNVLNSLGEYVADSLTARIFTRN